MLPLMAAHLHVIYGGLYVWWLPTLPGLLKQPSSAEGAMSFSCDQAFYSYHGILASSHVVCSICDIFLEYGKTSLQPQ